MTFKESAYFLMKTVMYLKILQIFVSNKNDLFASIKIYRVRKIYKTTCHTFKLHYL